MTKEELENVQGGISIGAICGIVGTVITFVLGFLDGYKNPIACRK